MIASDTTKHEYCVSLYVLRQICKQINCEENIIEKNSKENYGFDRKKSKTKKWKAAIKKCRSERQNTGLSYKQDYVE